MPGLFLTSHKLYLHPHIHSSLSTSPRLTHSLTKFHELPVGTCTAGSEYYNHIIREQYCFICGSFNSEVRYLNYTVLTEKMIMNNELDRMSKMRPWAAMCEGIFQDLSGRAKGNHKNQRTVCVAAEFRSRHLTDSNNRSTAIKISLCLVQSD
jgi:hypothetical protein